MIVSYVRLLPNNPVEGELESIPRLVLTTESFLFWKICARRGAISSYVRPLSPDGAKFQYLDWEIVRAFVHYYVTDSSMLCIIFGPLQRARGKYEIYIRSRGGEKKGDRTV